MVENLKRILAACSLCFVLHVAGLNSPLIFYRILEICVDHVAVEMIGLFDITDETFNQPIQNCNTGAYFDIFNWNCTFDIGLLYFENLSLAVYVAFDSKILLTTLKKHLELILIQCLHFPDILPAGCIYYHMCVLPF